MKPEFVIKYDGKTDIRATYIPVLKRKLAELGNGLSDTMVSMYSK